MKIKTIISVLFLTVSFIACDKNNLKDKTEKYVKDSLMDKFNDPKSFEFVSIKFDTIYSHSMIKSEIEKIKEEMKNQEAKNQFNKIEMSTADKDDIPAYKKIDSLGNYTISILKKSLIDTESKLFDKDSIHHINININYRAKNRLGALTLDNMFLIYHPFKDSFEVISLQGNLLDED